MGAGCERIVHGLLKNLNILSVVFPGSRHASLSIATAWPIVCLSLWCSKADEAITLFIHISGHYIYRQLPIHLALPDIPQEICWASQAWGVGREVGWQGEGQTHCERLPLPQPAIRTAAAFPPLWRPFRSVLGRIGSSFQSPWQSDDPWEISTDISLSVCVAGSDLGPTPRPRVSQAMPWVSPDRN